MPLLLYIIHCHLFLWFLFYTQKILRKSAKISEALYVLNYSIYTVYDTNRLKTEHRTKKKSTKKFLVNHELLSRWCSTSNFNTFTIKICWTTLWVGHVLSKMIIIRNVYIFKLLNNCFLIISMLRCQYKISKSKFRIIFSFLTNTKKQLYETKFYIIL